MPRCATLTRLHVRHPQFVDDEGDVLFVRPPRMSAYAARANNPHPFIVPRRLRTHLAQSRSRRRAFRLGRRRQRVKACLLARLQHLSLLFHARTAPLSRHLALPPLDDDFRHRFLSTRGFAHSRQTSTPHHSHSLQFLSSVITRLRGHRSRLVRTQRAKIRSRIVSWNLTCTQLRCVNEHASRASVCLVQLSMTVRGRLLLSQLCASSFDQP